jgi:hypothetical protein
MNAILRCSLLLAVCCAGASAAEPEVRVAASRGLSLAVVDASKASATREALHQTFAASLSTALGARCGGAVPVHVKCVGADSAAFNLGAGVYDAVLVIGRDVPDALRRVDAITLSASPGVGRRDRALHLVVANGDATLQGFLAAAFTGALADQKFLEVFNGEVAKVATTGGAKVAAVGQPAQ